MKPARAQQKYEQGLQAAAKRDYPAAHKLLMQVARIYTTKFSFHLNLAQISYYAAKYSSAHAAISKMLKLTPKNPEQLHQAYQMSMLLHNPAAAEYFAQKLAATDMPLSDSLLSRLYERTHKLDKALDIIHRDRKPNLAATLTKAKILRRQSCLDESLDLLNSIKLSDPANSSLSAEILCEKALTLDAQGDYEQAFSTLAKAKKMMYASPLVPQLKELSRNLTAKRKALTDSVTPYQYEQWAEQCERLPPSKVAVVTGHPRSGTTLIERMIARHSQMATIEESAVLSYLFAEAFSDIAKKIEVTGLNPTPDDLSSMLRNINGSVRKKMSREYVRDLISYYPEPTRADVIVDRNPMHMPLLPVLHAIIPNAPVVVILRDPRDVCLSFYMQYLELNPVSACLETLVSTAENYMDTMRLWLKVRNYNYPHFLEVRYEDFVTSPEREHQKIIEHLGGHLESIGEFTGGQPMAVNSERMVMTPSYEAVTKPIYGHAVGRWRNYESHFAEIEEILAPAIEAFSY